MFKKYIIGIIILLYSSNALAVDSKVTAYVNDLMNESLSILNNKALDTNSKKSKIRSMLANNMNGEWMARFTLGRLIKTLNQNDANRFITIYQKYVINSYANALSLYKGEKVNIIDMQQMNDEFFIVKTQVMQNDNHFISVNYLVMNTNNGYKVCDIITEGISLINTQRSEYTNLIASSGINQLIQTLENKTTN